MRSIWKYEISIEDEFTVGMPIGARFLCLSFSPRVAMWWEIPDTDAPTEVHSFRIFGTGQSMPVGDFVYLGTLVGYMVFHVYEVQHAG